MRVKELTHSKYSTVSLDTRINNFTTDEMIVVDIKYIEYNDRLSAFIHYYLETDLRRMKISKLLKKNENI